MRPRHVALLLAIGDRVAPGLRQLDADARQHVLAIVDRAIASRSSGLQRQLALFLDLIRWSPIPRFGRRFERLDAARQDRVLRWFHDAPLFRLRRGFWGVRTLIFMGYYCRPGIDDEIRYHPVRDGNRVHHAR